MKLRILLLSIVVILTSSLSAVRLTDVTTPDASQKAAVYQRIGLTDIKIVYHSPAVKNRKVWGKLVPSGKVWRAGANENTIIKFTTDVTIEGKLLPAGRYGLHMIPGEKEWTIIFSKNNYSWGSYFYNEKDDALRVIVKPEPTEFKEWLTYEFIERKNDSTTIILKWEKLAVPVRIRVKTKDVVLINLRKELNSLPFWYWRGTYNAAKYCLDNNINLEEALKWIDQSISVQENFQNLMLKADLLAKTGKTVEASSLKKYAKNVALDREITQYAYSFWYTDKKKTGKILIDNNRKFKNWFTNRSLGMFYTYTKNKQKALKYLKIALKKAPTHHKKGIIKAIENIKK